MRSRCAVLAIFAVVILSAVATPLAPPTTGWLYNDQFLILLGRFVFPFTATQCEPFYIYYEQAGGDPVTFYDPTTSPLRNLLTIAFPNGNGYVEWICNIPAGIAFNVDLEFNYIVQPGPSSDCLGDLTTTYSILNYTTANFATYTRTTSLPATLTTANTLPTTAFPTGTFSTITLNPNLVVAQTGPPSTAPVPHPTTFPPVSRLTSSPGHSSTVSSSSSSSPISSPPVSSSPKSRTALVGGVVGGAVAFVLLILALVLWQRRRGSVVANASSPIGLQPMATPGLATGELRPTDLPSTSRFSDSLGGMSQYPFSPPDPSQGAGLTSDNPNIVRMTGNPVAHADPIVGQRPSQSVISPLECESALPSRWSQEPSNGRFQASDILAPLQPSLTSETQVEPPDLTTVLGVISRARLSMRERQIIASVTNLLTQEPPDSVIASLPPPYSE